jgi:hypothetical protein
MLPEAGKVDELEVHGLDVVLLEKVARLLGDVLWTQAGVSPSGDGSPLIVFARHTEGAAATLQVY